MHSLSSNLFSRWRSRFQQQIYAQIRIQKEKQENNTQPGGFFFLIGTSSRLGFQLFCGASASRPPTFTTSALSGQSLQDFFTDRLVSPTQGSPGFRDWGGEIKKEGDSKQHPALLSQLRCQQPLLSAKVRAPALPGLFSLAPPPFPFTVYLFKLHLSLIRPHSALSFLHLFSPF